MTIRASTVIESFDAPMQGIALGLAGALIQQRAIHAADRREAQAIRAQTARMAYRRVMAQHAIDEAARQARAEEDRMRDAILRRGLLAKRARG